MALFIWGAGTPRTSDRAGAVRCGRTGAFTRGCGRAIGPAGMGGR